MRYSLKDDDANANGSPVRWLLEAGGFQRIGTASFEADGPPTHDLVEVLERVLHRLRNLNGRARLDHFWIYADRLDAE